MSKIHVPGTAIIRESTPDDNTCLDRLYAAAFPEEDLRPLVAGLLALETGVLSLAATMNGVLAGHGMVTTCTLDGPGTSVGLLGPLAVLPAYQRQGIGSALVRTCMQRVEVAGAGALCVLGDPAHYGRYGFARETRLLPPYPLAPAWRDAWQSITFTDAPLATGILVVPEPWRNRSLWSA